AAESLFAGIDYAIVVDIHEHASGQASRRRLFAKVVTGSAGTWRQDDAADDVVPRGPAQATGPRLPVEEARRLRLGDRVGARPLFGSIRPGALAGTGLKA